LQLSGQNVNLLLAGEEMKCAETDAALDHSSVVLAGLPLSGIDVLSTETTKDRIETEILKIICEIKTLMIETVTIGEIETEETATEGTEIEEIEIVQIEEIEIEETEIEIETEETAIQEQIDQEEPAKKVAETEPRKETAIEASVIYGSHAAIVLRLKLAAIQITNLKTPLKLRGILKKLIPPIGNGVALPVLQNPNVPNERRIPWKINTLMTI